MPYRDKSKIGQNIKRLRIEKNISQTQLSEKAGVIRPHLSSIENGRSSPEAQTLIDILVKGFDIPYSKALDLIAEWKVSEALEKAANPKQVINNIQAGKNSTIITGDNVTLRDIN